VQSEQLDAFDESDLVVLESLASQAGIALENASLYEQAQRLAVLEERGRLARELHDAVTQTLFSASLIAETLPGLWEVDEAEGRSLLQELRQLSRGAMAEMRTLLLELRPAALVEAELRDLLTQLGEAVTGRTGLPVSVRVEGDWSLPQEAHVALYRIAQEALNNIVKHARATSVHVELACEPGGEGENDIVSLSVSDDGVGFSDSDVEPGELGLSIMRERAESVGAVLSVASEPGSGTTVLVTWQGDLAER
jgi:signal transduction histidine kinase